MPLVLSELLLATVTSAQENFLCALYYCEACYTLEEWLQY